MKTASIDQIIAPLADWVVHFVTGIFTTNPVLLAVIGGFFLLIAASRAVARNRPAPIDPSRLFSASQKNEGFARAGGRCEMDAWLFTRCRAKAEHGDHHFPHSKGGATSMGNFTAACARHNLSKGAKIPTFWQTQRIISRRRRYFPKGITTAAGERFAHR